MVLTLSDSVITSTIAKPVLTKVLTYANGDTMDIVKEILQADKIAAQSTTKLAPYFKGNTSIETAKNIFDFVLYRIKYVEDPFGEQYVKTPSRTWHDRFADCKSMSIFTASILQNLAIPYSYRFASYSANKILGHVYVIAHFKDGDIIIDPVWKKFNSEKKYTYHKDYFMTQIYRVAGIGSQSDAHISEAELDLNIARERYQIAKDITESVRGIGALKSERYQDAIDVIDELHGVVTHPQLTPDQKAFEIGFIAAQAENGEFSIADSLHGIGASKKKAARTQAKQVRKQNRAAKKLQPKKTAAPKKKLGGKLKTVAKKLATKVKAGAKAVVKVVTAPQRLAAKAILEVLLPKLAPFFLYTFVPDASANNLPAKAKRKREKSIKFKKFIVNSIGMKENHFNGIIRNALTKKYKKSPETVLAQYMGGKRVGAIGFVGDIIKVGIELIGLISKVFGKKGESISADDVPDPENDLAEMNPAEKQATSKQLRTSAETSSPTNTDSLTEPGSNNASDGEANEFSTDGKAGGGKKTGIC